MHVSAPEATALEIVGYADQCGGLDNVAGVLVELVDELDSGKLAKAARLCPIAWTQWFGYLLDLIEQRSLADALVTHVHEHASAVAPLVRAKPAGRGPRNERWKLAVNASVEPDTLIAKDYVTEWRGHAPWVTDAQVEPDLVICRALIEIFQDANLGRHLAFRGGTALFKLHLRPAARYSEDIDLVQVAPAPIGEVFDAIRAVLDPWLGQPRRQTKEGSVNFVYRFTSEDEPPKALRLKVEINSREHFVRASLARPCARPVDRGMVRVQDESDPTAGALFFFGGASSRRRVHGGGTREDRSRLGDGGSCRGQRYAPLQRGGEGAGGQADRLLRLSLYG
jgi:hypothetical protein